MRFPRGLTRTPKGWRITVKRKGVKPFQKRFPASTPYETVESALLEARKTRTASTAPTAGTWAADITRYLTDYYAGRSGYAERKRHLELWKTALGAQTWRSDTTKDDISRVLHQWRLTLAADTCNKRRTALLALYHALDGKSGKNPIREIPKFRPPAPTATTITYAQVEQALKRLPRCKTQARLRLMAYTGIRHGQMMALRPDHWHQKSQTLLVPGTEKGRGTKAYALPLSKHAEDAMQAFDALDCWGTFTYAPMARMWKTAAVAVGIPDTTRPYDLRHLFGTFAYQMTGDLKVVKELLGHSSLQMTERYTMAAVPPRRLEAVALIGRHLPKRKSPPKSPPAKKPKKNR